MQLPTRYHTYVRMLCCLHVWQNIVGQTGRGNCAIIDKGGVKGAEGSGRLVGTAACDCSI